MYVNVFPRFWNRYKFDGKAFATSFSLAPGGILKLLNIQMLSEEQEKELLSLCWSAFQWEDITMNNCSQDVSNFQLLLEWA